uniref:V-set and immunoglobulin domain containing 2 n=1 Tax=Chelydra serpentina TaxID=8475 RepID=A0A8C3RT96_CHESE
DSGGVAGFGLGGGLRGSECAGPCVEVTVPRDPVMQEQGSSVELPCHYKTSVDKNFMLEWRFAPASTILYFTNDKLYKPGSQAGRLSLLHDPPTMGDATLQLANVRASDNGTYVCEVNNPPDFYGSGSGIIHFTVLMPPSTPVCKGTEYAHIGGDATLTCSSVEGVPAPIYAWSRVDSKTSLPLANMVQDEQTGKLQLTNLSLAFSGTYQCLASNQFGRASCQVTAIDFHACSEIGVVLGVAVGLWGLGSTHQQSHGEANPTPRWKDRCKRPRLDSVSKFLFDARAGTSVRASCWPADMSLWTQPALSLCPGYNTMLTGRK